MQVYSYNPISEQDADPVIRSQLLEDTGKHMLDSGDAYGRHWQQNRKNPPHEQPEYRVEDEYVVHNLYHYMMRQLRRTSHSVIIEKALYEFAYSDEYERKSWNVCIADFIEQSHNFEYMPRDVLDEDELRTFAYMVEDFDTDVIHWNTYNQENHMLSQDIQCVSLDGLHGEHVIVQVHNGCDIRGGYTAPRVYRQHDILLPIELHYVAVDGDWSDSESCLWGDEDLLYQRTIDTEEILQFLLEQDNEELRQFLEDEGEQDIIEMIEDVADNARERSHISGAIFRRDGPRLYEILVS
jgi:hypothetical protein